MPKGIKRVPVIIDNVPYFKCVLCQELKPIELMIQSSNRPYGVGSHCKVCHSLASKKSVAKKPEKYKAYQKQYYEENKEQIAAYKKQWYDDNPNYKTNYNTNYFADKRANDPIFKFKCEIRSLTNYAIFKGELTRSNACFHCYSSENIEAHHPEYSIEKALDVIWLCNKCHIALHKSLSEQPKVIIEE